MDANELGRWTRFAEKGGIGKCTAIQHCIAEKPEDLMFMKDDEITVLMLMPGNDDQYLGYCEGVVGNFRGAFVRFHGRLKKPVLTKRQSASMLPSLSRSSSQSGPTVTPSDSPTLPSQSLAISTVSDSPIVRSRSPPFPGSGSIHSPRTLTQLPISSSSSSLVPFAQDESYHARPISYSSMSSAMDSAPITPADVLGHDISGPNIVTELEETDVSPSPLDADTSATSMHAKIIGMDSPVDPRRDILDSTTARFPQIAELSLLRDESISFYDSEPSARISVALSDGEVGIGLSLLQDFVDGGADADAETRAACAASNQSGSSTADPSYATDNDVNASAETDPEPTPSLCSVAQSESQYSMSPRSIHIPLTSSVSGPPSASSVRSNDSHVSGQLSLAGSSDFEFGGEDWEGASDIYDDYRYSRYSIASKMSRLSKGSMYTVASTSNFEVPPIPAEHVRPSLDAMREAIASRERTGSGSALGKEASASKLNETLSTIGLTMAESEADAPRPPLTLAPEFPVRTSKGRPAPISVENEQTPSPLLHTTFGSPQASPTAASTTSLLSPALTSPGFPPTSGTATAVGQKLESELASHDTEAAVHSDGYSSTGEEQRVGQNPLVEDDEGTQSRVSPRVTLLVDAHAAVSEPTPSTSTSSSLHMSAITEKRMIFSTLPTPEQIPPPPYTPMSSSSQASSSGSTSAGQQRLPPQSTLRPVDPTRQTLQANTRTSLFLPHPHAPKPASSPVGPMYGRQPPISRAFSPPGAPPVGSVVHTLNMALAMRREGRSMRTTIYGRFDYDLAGSIGPVPVTFSLEPQMNVPANRPVAANIGRGSSVTATPHVGQRSPPLPEAARIMTTSMSVDNNAEIGSASKAIPRANFFPQVHNVRPRSRSFSGFDTQTTGIPFPKEQSRDDGSMPIQVPPLSVTTKRSKSAMATTTVPLSVPSPHHATVSHSPTVVRGVHAPSPLSLSQNIVVAPQPPVRSSTNPLPTSSSHPAESDSDGAQVLRTLSLGQPSSQFSHQNGPTLARPPLPRLTPTAAVSPVANMSLSPPSSPLSPKSIATSFPSLRHSQSAILTSPKSAIRSPSPRLRVSSQCRRSGETEASHRSDATSSITPSSPIEELSETGSIASQNSPKRSKFSMPPLRLVNSNQSSHYSIRSLTLSLSPSDTPDQKTVQVQDMDFELVKPTIPQSPLAFNSVDSLSQTLNSAALPDSLLRTDSPALSTLSGASSRPPLSEAEGSLNSPKLADSSEVEAHRQRELRWISVMSSVPASHARKSKKVKKMVLEGVPSSVRYLVWAHLADSKAKRMDGLYQRLCKREKVAASADIERDVQQSFVEQPQLQDGSLVNLLQAYLTMVPDIQYNRGLAMIASQLLLQSPEEDAFWTFISLMDSHLRPYFSNSIQLEVDASLFGKALEANDAAAAKKTFSDMAISPNTFCRAWFTTVFADALPSEHLKRVWDVFLFEGITFLFRVGIAIFSCCRRLLLQCTSRDALLELICRPPASCLPQNPEAFLELAFSVKLKDDDLRKQRNKMEAQVKRRTQPRTAPGVNVPSISLPKN